MVRLVAAGVVLLAVTALACAAGASPARLRECGAERASAPPLIDGRLAERDWQRAALTQRFTRFLGPEGREPPTRALALHDDEHLYFAFRAQDDDVWATMRRHDEPLWEEEVVEVYVDPDADGRDYVEIEVNPLGTVIDLLIPKAGDQADWQQCARWDCQGLQAAAHVVGSVDERSDRDRGWTAEIAVPLRSLPGVAHIPPERGETYRVQFFRIDRPKDAGEPTCLAWSATPTFHAPESFGRLRIGPLPALTGSGPTRNVPFD